MTLPTTVTVGPFVYAVVEDPVSRNHQNRGEHDGTHVRINIAPELSPQRKRVTFTHEVLHALIDAAGRGREGDTFTEEGLCDLLAPALVALVRQNPDVIVYLTADDAD